MGDNVPAYTKETLTEWADKIDSRLGPISGRDADTLARLLRATAARMHQLTTDRNDQDRALADADEAVTCEPTADDKRWAEHDARKVIAIGGEGIATVESAQAPGARGVRLQIDELVTLDQAGRIHEILDEGGMDE